MRFFLAALAAIFGLIPGAFWGYQVTPFVAGVFCPAPNGPNACGLLALFILIPAVAAITGMITFFITFIALKPKKEY